MDQSIVNFIFGIVSAGLIGFVGWIFKTIIDLREKTLKIEINYKDRFAQVDLAMAELKNDMHLKFEELKNFMTQENIMTRHNIRDAIQTMQLQLSEEFVTLEDHEKICKHSQENK